MDQSITGRSQSPQIEPDSTNQPNAYGASTIAVY